MASWCLPEDLVIQILVRLPVKSIMRFKCVCKRWCALTRCPTLIAMHLNMNSSNNLVSWNGNSDGLIVGHDGYHVFPKCVVGVQPVDLTFGFKTKPNTVLGPCDGIFCLYWFSRRDRFRDHFRLPIIVLWNPAIKEVNVLPKSLFDFPPYKQIFDCIVGFGFDSKSKTYKVVKLVSFTGDGPDRFTCAEVYTLSSGCWRSLQVGGEVRETEFSSLTNRSMYTSDGVFHWCMYQNGEAMAYNEAMADDEPFAFGIDQCDMAVVSFDMGEEVFRVTKLPKKFNLVRFGYIHRKDCTLTLLKDSLAVICYFFDEVSTTFVVWVMKENYKVGDDVESCWFHVFTSEPLDGSNRPLGFWNNNELLILPPSSKNELFGPLFLYDLVTRKGRELRPSGEPNFIFKLSLVSVKGGNS